MVAGVVLDNESIGALGKACSRWDDSVSYAGVSGRLRHFRATTV